MHPLTQDLSVLKDEELHSKVIDLNNRLNQSYRFGNWELINQIQMLLGDYQSELAARQARQLEDLLAKNNSKFKDIIDIK